ncbi:TetR/AcrR family transcriptional regulator [Sphingomonas sp. SUN039]|uniref:TetR/AcrR family transcriptional regulator n=1 Tax=Sphingomonas sp. SUN039 TaxID=2937787 RepID=UPI0021649805|nr:TetR/AcrR family transcriptional regulator [Sphingomonas sp. SUN039]UVO53108.1 TetR/AcrR family transcriptional regulator [Sphingomonas sp. SUN039]
MSTALEADPVVAAPAVSRKPQQGRSKASLERMLAAAEQLMIERGCEDFTLQEVSQRGNVSIGSIYLRFDSKDNLVRAVISDHLERMKEEEDRMLAVVTESASLNSFVAAYVEAYAELLKQHAPLLRLTMKRAENDPQVSEPGKRVALRVEDLSTAAMMAYADEMGGKDKELKANSSFHVIFATLARQLSLGSTGESVHDYDWSQLKRELGRMCLAYLKHAR